MLVFWKERLVYLATPKTGSTAIETALEPLASVVIQRPPELKHTPAQRYRRFIAPFLSQSAGEDFTVVALMREPIDWLGSWYRYRQRDGMRNPEHSTRGLTFDGFVEGYLRPDPPAFARVGSQRPFLCPPGEAPVDLIFRYEEIDRFVRFLEDRLDCEITLPRLMVSPPGATDLSPDLELRLKARLAEDIALYRSLGAAE
ncbi:sulfotransferase family protein [Albidovulum sp.]